MIMIMNLYVLIYVSLLFFAVLYLLILNDNDNEFICANISTFFILCGAVLPHT